MDNYNLISFKSEVRKEDLFELSPVTLMIFAAFCTYAKENVLPVMITSIRSDVVNNRVSSSHLDNRAIDISSRGWARHQCKFIESKLNQMFVHEGAIGTISGDIRACYWHNAGSGWHFHISSRNGYFG